MNRSKGQGERLNGTEGEPIICEWGWLMCENETWRDATRGQGCLWPSFTPRHSPKCSAGEEDCNKHTHNGVFSTSDLSPVCVCVCVCVLSVYGCIVCVVVFMVLVKGVTSFWEEKRREEKRREEKRREEKRREEKRRYFNVSFKYLSHVSPKIL